MASISYTNSHCVIFGCKSCFLKHVYWPSVRYTVAHRHRRESATIIQDKNASRNICGWLSLEQSIECKRLRSPGQWVKLSGTFVPQFKPHGATIKRFEFICNHKCTNKSLNFHKLIPCRNVTAVFFGCFLNGISPLDERSPIREKTAQSQAAVRRRQRCPLTCIVVHVVDLHGWLSSVVAEASVLLQQLQTFIAVKHRSPAVVRTQHCRR